MKEKDSRADVETFEQSIDEFASNLANRINEAARPVRERNNKRWEDFAKICRTPIIGNLYFNQMHGCPKNLEDEPKHDDIEGFRDDVERIGKMAEELEKMKAADMDKYGDEIIEPLNAGDPAGYYTPNVCTRRACYEILHLKPAIPDKYDFTSMAGVEKNCVGINVMESNTKEIIPFNDCRWSWQAGEGIRYYRKASPKSNFVDKNGLGKVFTCDERWVDYASVK